MKKKQVLDEIGVAQFERSGFWAFLATIILFSGDRTLQYWTSWEGTKPEILLSIAMVIFLGRFFLFYEASEKSFALKKFLKWAVVVSLVPPLLIVPDSGLRSFWGLTIWLGGSLVVLAMLLIARAILLRTWYHVSGKHLH